MAGSQAYAGDPHARCHARTAAANAFSTGLWFSAATLVWSLAVLFRRRAS
ncbi:MAG: hypothetical protein ACLTZH_13335 [Subdoligranulum sp.]